eukprot:gene13902-16402_t
MTKKDTHIPKDNENPSAKRSNPYDSSNIEAKGKGVVEDIKNTMDDAKNKAYEEVKKLVQDPKEEIESLKKEAKNMAGGAKDYASQKVEEVKHKAEDLLKDAKHKVDKMDMGDLKNTAEQVKHKVEGTAQDLKGKVFETFGSKAGPNDYQAPKNLGEFFKKNMAEESQAIPKFNMSEFYRGFTKMSGYAWGFALTCGLVAYGGYKLFGPKPAPKIEDSRPPKK